ncbi:Major facilitator superfamily domain [Phytophthora cactorum]|nr:Major facilitator superfamily domain [Phytophthora cactorum]
MGLGASMGQQFAFLAFVPMISVLPALKYLYEPEENGTMPLQEQVAGIWLMLQRRATWQPVCFLVLANAFFVQNAAWGNYLKVAYSFDAFQYGALSGIGACVTFASIVFALARRVLRNWPRVAFFSLLNVLLVLHVNEVFGVPPFWFAMGDAAGESFARGFQYLPVAQMFVAVCPEHQEGVAFALLTSVTNLAQAFSSTLSNMLLHIWPVELTDLQKVPHDFSGVWKLSQPLDDVAQYFGERVAFYFAWMEMYTRWLVVPSVAGVILFAALAYHWGTWGYEDEEVTRPEFYGDSSKPHDDKDSLLKYSVTFPCVAGSIVAVVTLAYLAFSTRDRLEAESLETKREAALIAEKVKSSGTITLEELRALAQLGVRWDFWIYLLLTPILYGLLIPVLDAAFTRAARFLNNWENHRTESRYQSHLILKVFSFRFVHVFASLYYYAFAPHAETSRDGETQAAKSDGMVRVAIQLASFMVTGQLWKNVMETLYPFVRRRLDARAKKRASNEQFNQSTVFKASTQPLVLELATEAMMSSNAVIHEQCVRLEQASDRAWEEAGLKQYDTFEDYTEMLVQFGYVSFFSLAFPLAPLLLYSIIYWNYALTRSNSANQTASTRHKASGIGVWLHVLQIMRHAKQEEDSRKVNLVSMDGDSFEVSRGVAAMSELVKTSFLITRGVATFLTVSVANVYTYLTLDDADDDEVQEIPLPNVKSPVLSKPPPQQPMREIEKPLKSADMHDVVSDWDANFVDIEQEILFELILAATTWTSRVASMIKGKTPQEIRETFNIVNDFTPEEEAQIREENKWCEEA